MPTFHATTATIEKGTYGKNFQISIMLILVFKTKGYDDMDYNDIKGQKNYKDFMKFMYAIRANRNFMGDKGTEMWSLNYNNENIYFYSQTSFIKRIC